MAKTKIICTLGPSSESPATLRAMIDAGMNVARLNFSHATHPEHRTRIETVRELNKDAQQEVLLLQDLEGFRIRIGSLSESHNGSIPLEEDQIIRLTNHENRDDPDAIPLDYDGSLRVLRPGACIFIEDGTIALEAVDVTDDSITCRVEVPGTVKERKGVNIPSAQFPFTGLTEKDQRDLRFGIEHRVDFIAQSFVRNGQDMQELKDFLTDHDYDCPLIAKIENRDGIRNLDEILDIADGVMVARGDLGVSLPIYEVPVLQKSLIRECKKRNKCIITATQMMESMTTNVKPTRADISDVANAVLDGSDYVMLSGETAIGRHPVDVVQMMARVIDFTERFPSLDYFTG